MHRRILIKIFFIIIFFQFKTFLAAVNTETSIAWKKFITSPDHMKILERCRKFETDPDYHPIDDLLIDYSAPTWEESVFLLLEDKQALDASKIKISKIKRDNERSMQIKEEDQYPPVFQVFDENNNLIYVVKTFSCILVCRLVVLERLINFTNTSCFNTVAPVAVGKIGSRLEFLLKLLHPVEC